MLRNHLTVAFRSIWKNKFNSFISVFGLAIGFTAAVLILFWCQDEKTYNQDSKHSENVFRAVPGFLSGGTKTYFPTAPPALAYVSRQVPGIEKSRSGLR
jgi:putative ABC transport system permease protein